jgi:hypothetical protein
MNKSFILLVKLNLLFFALYSQVNYCNNYFPIINSAELNLIEGKYEESLNYYLEAIKSCSPNNAFAKDIYNASVCAVKSKKHDIAFILIDSLIAKGIKKPFILFCKSYDELHSDRRWNDLILNYDTKYNTYMKYKNIEYKRLLLGIEFSDQEFRKKKEAYVLYRDTINKIDINNTQILNTLLLKYGFPSENIIGIEDPFLVNIPGYLIFHHQYQKMSKGIHNYDYTDILKNAIKRGELEPHRFAYWTAQYDRNFLGGWGIVKAIISDQESVILNDKFSEEDKKMINERRLNYGLETLEDFNKKALFVLKSKEANYFSFENYKALSVFELYSKKKLEHLLTFMEIVK